MKKLSKFLSLFIGLLTIGLTTGVAYGATSFSNVNLAEATSSDSTPIKKGDYIYFKPDTGTWNKDGATFKVIFKLNDSNKSEFKMIKCTNDTSIYWARNDSGVDCNQVQFLRMDKDCSSQWNYSNTFYWSQSGQNLFTKTADWYDTWTASQGNWGNVTNYTVSVSADPSTTYGTVSASPSSVSMDARTTLTATPKSGYKFVKWCSSSGTQISTDATYTVDKVTANSSYVAYFDVKIPDGTYLGGDDWGWHWPDVKTMHTNPSESKEQMITALPLAANSGVKVVCYTNESEAYYGASTLSVEADAYADGYRASGTGSSNTSMNKDGVYNLYVNTTTWNYHFMPLRIKYNNNGGSGTMSATYPGVNGNATVSANTFTRTGYTFNGWNTAADGSGDSKAVGSTINFLNETGNVTLYAQWVPETYTVTVNVNDSTMGTATASKTTGITYNEQITLTANPNTGYHFVKWNDNDTNATRNVNITSDTTFTATFAANSYNVTVNVNDSSMGSAIASKTSGIAHGENITLTATPNDGYDFVKWSDDSTDNPHQVAITEDTDFVAYFEPHDYTITYNTNDGTLDGTEPTSYTILDSVTLPTASNIRKDNFEFVGWYDNADFTGSPITSISKGTTGDKKYWAKWSATVQKYTVTVVSNNTTYGTVNVGTISNVPEETVPSIDGNKLTINGTTVTATPTTSDEQYAYHFLNWDNVPEKITGNVTITANFDQVARYSGKAGNTPFELKYQGNGVYTSKSPVSFAPGTEIQLIDNLDGQPKYAGIHDSSKGCWQDIPDLTSPTGHKVFCDEDEATSFDLSIDVSGNDKHWVANYNPARDEEFSIYVGGVRYTMTKTDDTPEGFTAQYKAVVSNVSHGQEITYKSNFVQNPFSVSFANDTNEEEISGKHTIFGTPYVYQNGGYVQAPVEIFLKVNDTGSSRTYHSYVSGLKNESTGYTLIQRHYYETGDTVSLYPLLDGGLDPQEHQQYKVQDLTVSKDDYLYLYQQNHISSQGQGFRSFGFTDQYGDHKLVEDYTGKNAFTCDNSHNALCIKEGASDTYTMYVKVYDYELGNNVIAITSGDPTAAAKTFAQGFNAAISAQCHSQGGYEAGLKEAWEAQASEFEKLSPQAQAYFAKSSSVTDEDILACIAKYEYVYGKNGAVLELTDFMNRQPAAFSLNSSLHYSLGENEDQTVLIVVITASATLLATTSALLLLLKKKKKAK